VTRRHRRLVLALTSLGLAGLGVALALWALQDTVTYYHSPAQLAAMPVKPTGQIRVGGLVIANSLRRPDATSVEFRLSDETAELKVRFAGALPDLFREGQGIIAEGHLESNGLFRASSVLAKHDETYMPREIVKMLKAQHHWRGGSSGP
jgi:cytochrome c-type biogenesis protein CcmE